MTDEVLEQVIRSYMQTEQDIYAMVWHGGEPTLMPQTFYQKAVARLLPEPLCFGRCQSGHGRTF